MDQWTPLRLLLAFFVPGIVIALVSRFGHSAKPRRDGWRRITLGPMSWMTLVLGSVLFIFMTYVRFFVGSARADADAQMAALTLLVIVFGGAIAYAAKDALKVFRCSLEWRHRSLRFRDSEGNEIQRTFSDIAAVQSIGTRRWQLQFADGGCLTILENARGARQFLDAIIHDEEFEPEV